MYFFNKYNIEVQTCQRIDVNGFHSILFIDILVLLEFQTCAYAMMFFHNII